MTALPIPLSRPADEARPRHDWTLDPVEALFDRPFTEMMFRAAEDHRRRFSPTESQLSPLLSAKTGGCPGNCGYRGPSQVFKTAAPKLTAAGLDHDNHDLDPRPDHDKVVASWTRQDRHDPDASLLADLKIWPMSLAAAAQGAL